MKSIALGLSLMVVSLVTASAQVTVEVTQDQQQFLPGEALPVAVRIINHSGQALHLGAEADWLTFALEGEDGVVVAKLGDVPVLGEFALKSSKMATKRVDLAPYFSLTHQGTYTILATLHIKDWDREVASAPQHFTLIEGTKLWEQEVGLPRVEGATNSLPEVRRYILQQANYLKGQIRLYLRVSDGYGRIFRVFAIGPMVSFSRPEPQVDKNSNLHVLYQNAASAFSYTMFNSEGMVLAHQTYDYISARPRLRVQDDGSVTVIGGVRRFTANDVPTPRSAPPEMTSPPATTATPAHQGQPGKP